MDIKSQIVKDRMEALRAGQSERKATLDYILGEVQRKEKDPKATGDLALDTIKAFIKSLQIFIEQHGEARPEQAAGYKKEIELLQGYLPATVDAEGLRAEIAAVQASGVSGKGLIMKALAQRLGAQMDGRLASQILAEMGVK